MNKSSKIMISVIIFTVILLVVLPFWYSYGKSNAHSNPSEVLVAIDSDLLLIPGYMANKKTLYFFIKDKNQLGASYVHKDFFGWKAGMLTWGPMDTNLELGLLSSSKGHGEYLVYGLFKNNGDYFVEVNGEPARMLNLQTLGNELVQDYHLEDLFIWYYESDIPIEQLEVNLFAQNKDEPIDTTIIR